MPSLARIYDDALELNQRAILAAIPPRPGATVVDLGCGDGTFTVRVGERTAAGRLIGLEVESYEADQARAPRRGRPLRPARAAALPGRVDRRRALQPGHRAPAHADLFLREIRRVLRPTGYAVVSTNNLSSWHNVVALALGWQPPVSHVSDIVVVGNPTDSMEGHLGDGPVRPVKRAARTRDTTLPD